MNRLSHLALAALTCCITGLAHADTTYSADFTLPGYLPALRTGSPAFDGPNSLPGQWNSAGDFHAIVNSRDLLSSTVNPATGAVEQTWGQQNHSADRHHAASWPLALGDTQAHVLGPNEWSHTIGQASVDQRWLRADITQTDRLADADARAFWSRDFSLDAHSSFTFSGLATLGISGDSTPLAAVTTFDSNASFASLSLGDVFGRVRTTIGASFWGLSSGLSDIVSYSVGPNGLLALTITNNGDSALQGSLNAGAYVDVTPPIPEPETWLLLLAGAGIVSFTARKRQRQRAALSLS